MDYQDFEKLYRKDPIIFHLGMELLEDRGRDMLSISTDQALCAAVTKKLSELISADKVMDVVKAARAFAGLSVVERLSYAARCGIKLEYGPKEKRGVCPLCGGQLRYDWPRAIGWTCKKCGATGRGVSGNI